MAENKTIGTSIFFIIIFLLSLGGLIFLLLKSFAMQNLMLAIISVIFLGMIISGIILSIMTGKYKVLQYTSFGVASISFLSGFIIWLIIGGSSSKSVLSLASIGSNSLFTSISGDLPIFVQFLMEGIVIPFAEETFWIIGMTAVLLVIFKQLGKKYEIFNNKIFIISLISIIGGVTFGIFHVQQSAISFIISAIVFRTILYVIILGDLFFDWFKAGAIGMAFAFGAHVGNNWGNIGFSQGFNLLIQEGLAGGIIIIFFVILIIASIDKIGAWFADREVSR